MKTLLPLSSVLVVLSLITVAASDDGKKAEMYGWRPGELMPFHVVDFAVEPGKHGCGCPSKMVSNAKGKGLMIWSKTGDAQAYDLAVALDGDLSSDNKVQGFLLHFGSSSLDALRRKAESYPLTKFHVSQPRDSVKPLFAKADAAGDSETLVFFVDHKEIKQIFATKSGDLTEERIREIDAAAAEFVGPVK